MASQSIGPVNPVCPATLPLFFLSFPDETVRPSSHDGLASHRGLDAVCSTRTLALDTQHGCPLPLAVHSLSRGLRLVLLVPPSLECVKIVPMSWAPSIHFVPGITSLSALDKGCRPPQQCDQKEEDLSPLASAPWSHLLLIRQESAHRT